MAILGVGGVAFLIVLGLILWGAIVWAGAEFGAEPKGPVLLAYSLASALAFWFLAMIPLASILAGALFNSV